MHSHAWAKCIVVLSKILQGVTEVNTDLAEGFWLAYVRYVSLRLYVSQAPECEAREIFLLSKLLGSKYNSCDV